MTIAVILCAARKHNDAGYFRKRNGQPVRFVAQPDLAQPSKIYTYSRPDDVADVGGTWRELLSDYNKRNRDANQLGLLKAWQLYRHKTYGQLVRQLGEENVYILSAGWGLLPANYLTPYTTSRFPHLPRIINAGTKGTYTKICHCSRTTATSRWCSSAANFTFLCSAN